MAKKKKKNEHKKEPINKIKITNKLQKEEALSPETAKSLKALGLADKKFTSHLEALEVEGKIKKTGKNRYYVIPSKVSKQQKGSTMEQYGFLWTSFILIFGVLLIYIILN